MNTDLPEISYDQVEKSVGFDICFVTRPKPTGARSAHAFGMPFAAK
jgi:ribosomal protein L5